MVESVLEDPEVPMAEQWVRLCALTEAPSAGNVAEFEVGGRGICLGNVDGRLAALDNKCPHRGGPLGQGWIDGGAVVCPWHSWCFDLTTGNALPPDSGHVAVFPVRTEGADVLIDLG